MHDKAEPNIAYLPSQARIKYMMRKIRKENEARSRDKQPMLHFPQKKYEERVVRLVDHVIEERIPPV